MDVSGARTRQKEMPVLLFLVRLLSINEGYIDTGREQ
jgi:hypothetical protein